jgi:hypothetical protein
MPREPFDRQLVRELARAYARAAVDSLINEAPEPAKNAKAARGRRDHKKSTNRRKESIK